MPQPNKEDGPHGLIKQGFAATQEIHTCACISGRLAFAKVLPIFEKR